MELSGFISVTAGLITSPHDISLLPLGSSSISPLVLENILLLWEYLLTKVAVLFCSSIEYSTILE